MKGLGATVALEALRQYPSVSLQYLLEYILYYMEEKVDMLVVVLWTATQERVGTLLYQY